MQAGRRSAIGLVALMGALILGGLQASDGLAPAAVAAQTGKTASTEEAQDTLGRFAGAWVGKTTADAAVERKATLAIDLQEGGGFSVTWTSFEAPTRSDAGIIRRERKLAFVPTASAGLFRADGQNDPIDDLAAWARVDGDVLSVSTIAVQRDGRLERQIYDRTRTADGLFLSYRRYLDADLVRLLDVEFVPL